MEKYKDQSSMSREALNMCTQITLQLGMWKQPRKKLTQYKPPSLELLPLSQ
jgi:hypothetical protein